LGRIRAKEAPALNRRAAFLFKTLSRDKNMLQAFDCAAIH
jgi:hypothetical protein